MMPINPLLRVGDADYCDRMAIEEGHDAAADAQEGGSGRLNAMFRYERLAALSRGAAMLSVDDIERLKRLLIVFAEADDKYPALIEYRPLLQRAVVALTAMFP